jgi:hypothetical protein
MIFGPEGFFKSVDLGSKFGDGGRREWLRIRLHGVHFEKSRERLDGDGCYSVDWGGNEKTKQEDNVWIPVGKNGTKEGRLVDKLLGTFFGTV